LNDAQLVERALAGDQEAFRGLVSRHQRSVYNLLGRMLRDPALAEDLTQDTFVRAFAHLAQFDSRYKFGNWILRIAHNAAIDAIRRRGPDVVPLEGDNPAQSLAATIPAPRGEDGLRRVERIDLERALDAAMARLRPEYRQLLVLRYHEELSYEEIVAITGLPLGSVKSFLHRARAEMAALLTAAGWRETGGSG
jgi:RNA polymerase sigma-70 factor (ECF subfamily)